MIQKKIRALQGHLLLPNYSERIESRLCHREALTLSHENVILWQSEYSGRSNALPISTVSIPKA